MKCRSQIENIPTKGLSLSLQILEGRSRHSPLLWLLGTVFCCIFCSIAVQCLPIVPIGQNIEEARKVFAVEQSYPKKSGIVIDNFTDAIILQISSYTDNSSAVEKAFANYWNTLNPDTSTQNTRPVDSLLYPQLVHYPLSYSRYWHGYQVLTRPLLSFFDYSAIRQLNCAAQILLLAVILYLLFLKKYLPLLPAFALSYLLLMPVVCWSSLSCSLIYYVYSVFSLLLLTKYPHIKAAMGEGIYFAIIGIVTSWIDFLTYPVVTLSVPMTVLFYISPSVTLKSTVLRICRLSFCWGFGYIGMWGLKWGMTSLIFSVNMFQEALENIQLRSSAFVFGEQSSRLYAIWVNFRYYFENTFFFRLLFLTAMTALFYAFYSRKKLKRIFCRSSSVLAAFLLISLSAPAWYFLVANHSIDCSFFTFRAAVATFFPWITTLFFPLDEK